MRTLREYWVFAIILKAAIIMGLLGCSENNDSRTEIERDVPKRGPVNTEGFRFHYTGPFPTTFSEAPELAKMVEEGKLPPIIDRLPEEPLVVPPIERIGQYGGTWKRGFTGPIDRQNIDRIMHDHMVYYDLDGHTLMPHIAKGWDMSEDGTTFTFHLRKGMKVVVTTKTGTLEKLVWVT